MPMKTYALYYKYYAKIITLFALFDKSNTEWTNFPDYACMFYVYVVHVFVLYSTCAIFELVKSPEVTLCG